MPMRKDRIDRYLDTIMAIAKSRDVEEFVIGYTSRPAWKRFQEYQARDYEFLVILEDKMLQADALDLEERLQNDLKFKCDKRYVEHRKYNELRKLDSYRRNSGPNNGERDHSVYMAWWGPDDD